MLACHIKDACCGDAAGSLGVKGVALDFIKKYQNMDASGINQEDHHLDYWSTKVRVSSDKGVRLDTQSDFCILKTEKE